MVFALDMPLPENSVELQAFLKTLVGHLVALEQENNALHAENTALREEVKELQARNQRLETEVADLRQRLGLNSHNSHKPPSSDLLPYCLSKFSFTPCIWNLSSDPSNRFRT